MFREQTAPRADGGGHLLLLTYARGRIGQTWDWAMYTLIIVIGMLSPATSSVVPVGVTSQIVGKFKTKDGCEAAASRPIVGGTISDLSLTRGVYWYCVYSGEE
jgi:hypothetical protein